MEMIAMECKFNPWYFFREIAKAPPQSGNVAVRLQANRGNVALWWLYFNHITQFLIQPRQTGKSLSTDSLMVLLLGVICVNTKINLLTKNDQLRRMNIVRIKELLEELPPYLYLKRADDLNNTEELTINALGNRYSTNVPQSSPKGADNMGRGLTTPTVHVDEAPFQNHIEIALKAALPGMNAAREAAEREGAPYGLIFTTTAGKKDDRDGAFIYQELMESAPWTEQFFDCLDRLQLEETIRVNSRNGKIRVRSIFNHRQLGRTDEWMLRALEDSFQSGDSANRDFFNMWTHGSQTNPIPIALLERMSGSLMEPLYCHISAQERYITRWYIPEEDVERRMSQSKFILMLDSSEAIGKDDIAMLLIDVETAETVAAGNFNETNLISFSKWLLSWFIRFPNVTGLIERRSTGGMILDYLIIHMVSAGIDPFKRLYNTVVQEYAEHPSRYEDINMPMGRRDPQVYIKYKSCFGFATSGSGAYSRDALYSTSLMTASKRGCDYVHDKTLIDQITALIEKNGRVDHPPGGHDDMVIAWLLGFWFMIKGVNLAFYGIDSRRVMLTADDVTQKKEDVDEEDVLIQNALREKIERLIESIGVEKDPIVARRLEQEAKSLMRSVVIREGEVFGVDELLRKAKEHRIEKRRLNQFHNSPYHMQQPEVNFGYGYGQVQGYGGMAYR